MKDDDWDAMLETVDALFCIVAEQVADQEGVPFEEAQEGAWTLFERGLFRLADDGEHLGIEPCTSRNERRVAAKQNGLLASFRRRVAEDTASGKVRSPWSGVFAGPT